MTRNLAAVTAVAGITAATVASGFFAEVGADATAVLLRHQAVARPAAIDRVDGILRIGTLLPRTGALAALGPAQEAGVALAVRDINEAGGVNGRAVELTSGDSGDLTTDTAQRTVDAAIASGTDVVVGAASSAVTLRVVDRVTQAGILQISPSNTSVAVTGDRHGYRFFRLAPPDSAQGAALGALAVQDGRKRLAILAVDDEYGRAIASAFALSARTAGGDVVKTVFYPPGTTALGASADLVAAARPTGLLLAGYQESAAILNALSRHKPPASGTRLYLVDGNLPNPIPRDFPAGRLKGSAGTTPGSRPALQFRERLRTAGLAGKDVSFAAEAYDSVVEVALAAQAAGSEDADAVSIQLPVISAGGVACRSFAQCSSLLRAGMNVDYVGQSGPADLAETGDPQLVFMGVYRFGADGKYVPAAQVLTPVPAR